MSESLQEIIDSLHPADILLDEGRLGAIAVLKTEDLKNLLRMCEGFYQHAQVKLLPTQGEMERCAILLWGKENTLENCATTESLGRR